jgi:carotenoid cleavage dioxygenase-like enzyme
VAATPKFGATYAPLLAEADVRDCSVEGELPPDLSGGFHAVGPDPQYPLAPGNIAFDGEGHIRLLRIKNGRVDYRSRYTLRTDPLPQSIYGRRRVLPLSAQFLAVRFAANC